MKKISWKSKFLATAIHFGLSLLVFLTVFLLVVFVFFPSFYFEMCGGIQGLYIVFIIDVVLGPLLTFLVYNPKKNKREIISDFTIIALVQLVALAYGLYTLYQEHPKLLVLYDSGTATALTHREVQGDERFSQLKSNTYSFLEGVPITFFTKANGKISMHPPLSVLKELGEADKVARRSLDSTEKSVLNSLEKEHKKIWVIAVMGKYTGAFIFLDKNFNYLAKTGEKETFM